MSPRKKRDLAAGASGFVFAMGLGIAGMTQPLKVAAFLDVTGAWDPSLAFVMVGAIGVHLALLRVLKRPSPMFAARFALPTGAQVDTRLLVGAALFGLGWGIAGYCPGPAVVSVASVSPVTLAFVGAMLAGMLVYALAFERRPSTQPA